MTGVASRRGGKAVLLAAALVVAGTPALAQQAAATSPLVSPVQGVAPAAQVPAVPPERPKLKLAEGTMIRLMVLKEVSSRDSKAGDRFVLRVDQDVMVDGIVVIPTGAKAWGEVVAAQGSAEMGESGTLNARLLHVELPNRQIPIRGERKTEGGDATEKLVLGVIGFGVFGLLMKGNNAKLKGGDIINGYIASDTLFDAPLTASTSP